MNVHNKAHDKKTEIAAKYVQMEIIHRRNQQQKTAMCLGAQK
jgi:hypothetical protein